MRGRPLEEKHLAPVDVPSCTGKSVGYRLGLRMQVARTEVVADVTPLVPGSKPTRLELNLHNDFYTLVTPDRIGLNVVEKLEGLRLSLDQTSHREHAFRYKFRTHLQSMMMLNGRCSIRPRTLPLSSYCRGETAM